MSATIKFVFMDFEIFLPFLLNSLVIALMSVFLYFSGKEKERDLPDIRFLELSAVINLLSIIFLFFIPVPDPLRTPIASYERIIFYGLAILRSLIYTISRLLSLGLIIFIIGRNHREQFGDYLMISGLSWLLYFTLLAISLPDSEYRAPLLPRILYLDSDNNICGYYIFQSIYGIINLFNPLGFIFLIVHGFKNNDQNLKLAGFIYVLGFYILTLGYIPLYVEQFCT
jgi:hypothetical protein